MGLATKLILKIFMTTINLSIPKNSQLLIEMGKNLDFQSPFYQIKKTVCEKIPLAKLLNINKEKIYQYIKKTVGQKVKKNEIIAQRKGFLSEKKIVSPIDGEIIEINHENGEMIIAYQSKDNKTKNCFFKGVVKEIKNNIVSVQIKNGVKIPLDEVNLQAGGEIFFYRSDSLFFQISEEDIKDKIVITEKLTSHVNLKCETLGCSGFLFIEKEEKPSIPYGRLNNIKYLKRIIDNNLKYCLFSNIDQFVVFYH